MKIVYSEKCLEYGRDEPFKHIEFPKRVEDAQKILKEKGYEFVEPKSASLEDLLKVHASEYVKRVKEGDIHDPDTPAYKDIYEYARLSAGGAVLAAEVEAFSLMRPPGHHAGRDGPALGAFTLGFCYFNNITIAVKKLNKPTLILDIDGHHGNGTQEIFLGDPKVKYISLHRSMIYPGTGFDSERNCINVAIPSYIGDKLYLKTLDKALSQVDMKGIELVGISAGFDSHEGDLASLGLSSECFREIGRRVRKLGLRTFGVLEGGYSGKNVAEDLHQLIEGLEGK